MSTSALCELALALGLTLGGHCVAPPAPVPAGGLPPDDPSAYALPEPPPPTPPPAPEPVVMPPVVIEKVVQVAAPAPAPVVVQPPPAPPPPDPMETALTALWMAAAGGAPHALRPVVTSPPPPPPVMPVVPEMAALDLAAPVTADYGGPRRTSSQPVDNTRIITADRYITGILETGINSQVGGDDTGTVIVQTARDVHGYHGRKVLMPKGSRLICDYQAPEDMGSSRLAITCQRVLIAGHRAEIRDLDSLLSDVQGRAGTSGEVDKRFWERYGTAFLLTGISMGVRFGNTLTLSGGDDDSAASQTMETTSSELSNRLGEITASVLEQTLDLAPIITIPQGTRIQIRPATDWYIAAAEPPS